jgi:hypothetical protein
VRDVRRNAMRFVKVNRDDLLIIVRKNLIKHIEDFKEAVSDYKEVVLKMSKDNLELALAGTLEKIDEIKSIPRKPESYESSYTRAIRMLEMSVDEEIELEEDIFNQLVLDEWNWKSSFTVMNTMYKGMK